MKLVILALLALPLCAHLPEEPASLITDVSDASGKIVFVSGPTLIVPTIASIANRTHDHSSAGDSSATENGVLISLGPNDAISVSYPNRPSRWSRAWKWSIGELHLRALRSLGKGLRAHHQ